MSVVVETLEGLKRRVVFQFEQTDVVAEKQKRLQQLSRRVKMDGFRPGKVPLKVVERQYGDSVENEIISDLINDKYRVLVQDSELNVAGRPDVKPVNDEQYSFELTFEVMPEVTVQGLDTLQVEKLEASVTEADVEAMIQRLREQRTQFVAKDDHAAAQGDQLLIDFQGKIDGEIFEGGSGSQQKLTLGSGVMIPGFEAGLVGLKKGQTKVLSLVFPEDYRAEHLRSKSVEFEVSVHEVLAAQLPELNSAFIQQFGVESGTIEDFKVELRKNMERELGNTIEDKLKAAVLDAVLEKNQFDVPNSLIQSEVINMAQRSLPQPKNEQEARYMFDIAQRAFASNAERSVKLGLLLAELIKQENIQLDELFVDKRLERVAATYEDPTEAKEQFKEDKAMMENVRNLALEDQLVAYLLDKATVSVQTSTFNDIMQPKNV